MINISSKRANIKRSWRRQNKSKSAIYAASAGFLVLDPLLFVTLLRFSSIGAANIHRITWANVKRAGDDGHQLKHNARRGRWKNNSVPLFPRPP
jgi:hypothetical protein